MVSSKRYTELGYDKQSAKRLARVGSPSQVASMAPKRLAKKLGVSVRRAKRVQQGVQQARQQGSKKKSRSRKKQQQQQQRQQKQQQSIVGRMNIDESVRDALSGTEEVVNVDPVSELDIDIGLED